MSSAHLLNMHKKKSPRHTERVEPIGGRGCFLSYPDTRLLGGVGLHSFGVQQLAEEWPSVQPAARWWRGVVLADGSLELACVCAAVRVGGDQGGREGGIVYREHL